MQKIILCVALAFASFLSVWSVPSDSPSPDSVVALKITPKDGAIANVGGWTSFVFAMEPAAEATPFWHNLKCTGKYRLRVAITDETDGQTREFDYPIRDINKDLWPVARIAPIPFGVCPQKGRAYTVAVKVLEGDRKSVV